MSLNLSTLTNASTSASILNEAATKADFLDSVPILINLANRGNKGGDAKQTTGLNQPRALPLIKNPSGNLGGYLYIPNVAGNYATGPSVTIGSNQTWEGELDMVITQWGEYVLAMGGGDWSGGFGLIFYPPSGAEPSGGAVQIFSKGAAGFQTLSGVNLGTSFNVKFGYNGTQFFVDINGVRKYTQTPTSQASSITHTLELNQQANIGNTGNYAIQKAKLTVNNAVVFDCDFNGSTSIRHGDTKFNCVGGPVVLTKAGNDPITVVKKDILRLDGVNDGFKGLFDQTIDGGYMFAAFSVLGTGGEAWGRVFTVNKTEGLDYDTTGNIVSSQRAGLGNLGYAIILGSDTSEHVDLFDDANGDILHEVKVTNSAQTSLVNGADFQTKTTSLALEAQEFNVGKNRGVDENAAIDLQYLALFPASLTTEQANSVRSFINNKKNVFSLVDNSFYFFDPQKATFTGNFTGANTLDGYITGSDLGDTDVRSNLTLEQATLNDQPSTDGYTITFNDSAEHLEFDNGASQNLSGWQICGSSIGTFAYRVQGAVSELNLLGNLGNASYRKAGDLYGIILLPETASGADVEAARSLLIDRGAADGVSSSSVQNFWRDRDDIVDFKNVNFTNVNNFLRAFRDASFLSDFPAIDASNGTNFTSAWGGTTALTSFPSGAKLGMAADNVNFTQAWQFSGLTSFPNNIDLSKGGQFVDTWRGTNLASFSTPITGVNAKRMRRAWHSCTQMTDFSYNVFSNWNPSVISTQCFDSTWFNCTSLTAQSVENILTSIDASGQYATSDGDPYQNTVNTQLADAGIDIDYNTATGSLSAATNTAVTSLKAKGWSIIVNNVTL